MPPPKVWAPPPPPLINSNKLLPPPHTYTLHGHNLLFPMHCIFETVTTQFLVWRILTVMLCMKWCTYGWLQLMCCTRITTECDMVWVWSLYISTRIITECDMVRSLVTLYTHNDHHIMWYGLIFAYSYIRKDHHRLWCGLSLVTLYTQNGSPQIVIWFEFGHSIYPKWITTDCDVVWVCSLYIPKMDHHRLWCGLSLVTLYTHNGSPQNVMCFDFAHSVYP